MKNKFYIKGEIIFSSALHIGGGMLSEIGTENTVMKTPDGEPFIPGSSIKGVFRSFVEKVVISIDGLRTCQLNNDNQDICLSINDNWSAKDKSENTIMQELENGLCDVCKVFGSPHKASKVFFSDAYVKNWAEATQVRDGVVIDRDSEKAVDKLKYDYEIVPVDSTFEFRLTVEDVQDKEFALVALGLKEMKSGLMSFGGKTSRGLGNFILKNMEIYHTDFFNTEHLKKYLLNAEIETKMLKIIDADNKLQEAINELF